MSPQIAFKLYNANDNESSGRTYLLLMSLYTSDCYPYLQGGNSKVLQKFIYLER